MKKKLKNILFFIAICISQQTHSQCPPTTVSYTATGGLQSFTVPAGVNQITIEAAGADGGNFRVNDIIPPFTLITTQFGGNGARTRGTFSVSPGQQFQIVVARRAGTHPGLPIAGSGAGGGGATFIASGGNGYSDFSLSNIIMVAGGGGGAGSIIRGGHADIEQNFTFGVPGAPGFGGIFQSGGGATPILSGLFGTVITAGGTSALNGAAGGTSLNMNIDPFGTPVHINGGYGGGGAAGSSGGGGAGISGGSGGITIAIGGFGGHTYNAGTNTQFFPGDNNANGFVNITYILADTTPPVITCPTNITVNNDLGVCGATVTFSSTATDNCPGVNVVSVPASGTVFSVGTTSVTSTATDAVGLTTSCTFNVTVNDTEAPVVTCPTNITVNNDVGICGATVTFSSTATDNCPGVNVVSVPASGTVFSIGTTLVTSTATDTAGLTTSCTFNITVNDTEALAITCPTDITVSNDPGVCGATVTFSSTATDNCPGVIVTSVPASGTVFPIGTTLVTSTATDTAGLTATCTFNITVNDTEDPVVQCQDISIQLDSNGDASITAMDVIASTSPLTYTVDETITFNPEAITGSIVSLGDDQVSGDLPIGFNFSFFENNYSDFRISSNGFIVFGDETDHGCCSGETLPNNSGTEPQNLIAMFWEDLRPPSGGTISYETIGTTPNRVLIVEFDAVHHYFSGFPATGQIKLFETTNNIEVHVTDQSASGNHTLGIQNIQGTEGYAATGKNGQAWTASNFAVAFNYLSANNPSDNCGIASTTIDIDSFDCSNIGSNTVIVTVTDTSGNTGTCEATVTVEDNIAPTWIIAPSNMTVECDGTGNTDDLAAWLTSFTGADNCPNSAVTNDSTGLSDDCGSTGFETVTFILDDGNGNSITLDATFTIVDTADPIMVCPMDVNITADPGVCGAEVAFSDAIALDSCGSVTVVQTAGLPSHTFFPVGVSTIEFTATDECGNDSVCSFTITITDDELAIAVCQDITIQLDEFGDASIIVDDIDGGSTDNCGVDSINASQTDFTCADIGDNDITLTVTDVNGNTSTCIAVVTVEDITLPVAVCQGITVPLDANGTVTITGMDIGSASTDACGIVSYDIDIDTFDCSNIGDNLVTLIITDPSGNTATCTAIVTIEDVTSPVLVCADVTLELGPDGTLNVDPEALLGFSPTTYHVITISSDNQSNAEGFTDITVNVTDAAAISFDWDYTTTDSPLFDSFGILLNGVYTEVSDPNGANTQSGNYALNVAPGDVFGFRSYSEDGVFGAATTTVSNFIPGFIGQFDPANWTELLINSDGSATFVEIPGGPLSFDACGITILAVDVTEVTCADIGTPIVITVFASDASGNLAACQSTVTVVDLLEPEVTCPADQTVDPGAGNLYYVVPDYWVNGEATATDNCTDPVVITSQDPAVGALLPDGVHVITVTAEDEYGNVGTCTFELTVESELGIGDTLDLGSIILYPNPANNIVRLSNPDSLELESLAIYDLTGRLVHTTRLDQMGTEISIDVSRYANATYMVIIKGVNGTLTKQLIVNNY